MSSDLIIDILEDSELNFKMEDIATHMNSFSIIINVERNMDHPLVKSFDAYQKSIEELANQWINVFKPKISLMKYLDLEMEKIIKIQNENNPILKRINLLTNYKLCFLVLRKESLPTHWIMDRIIELNHQGGIDLIDQKYIQLLFMKPFNK